MDFWQLRGRALALDRPRVVGILNVTPDSFSDGGRFREAGPALARARELAAAGADLIDVGGESTRPGADPVSPDEEAARVLPVIRLLRDALDLPLSVDTRRAAVAREALAAGAHAVNDVSALGDPEMLRAVAESGAGLVLMHMRGTPRDMQEHAVYRDVAHEVTDELAVPLRRAELAGIAPARVVVDPGIGFAKTAEQNLELIARLQVLARLGRPILLGPSRKAFIGALLGGAAPDARDAGTAGACVAGLARGARIFRVHDVRITRHALDVAFAILRAAPEAP
ncbi:MAG TPA: dihydropteroate synthase [Longimicrobiaceae bacterium]|nr:dihydropteroate synthase [Longimicrobiaceae bacterium]